MGYVAVRMRFRALLSFALRQGCDDALLVGFAQVRVHGQAHDLAGNGLDNRGTLGAAQVSVGGLLVERHLIINSATARSVRSAVRTADPTGHGVTVGSAVRTVRGS